VREEEEVQDHFTLLADCLKKDLGKLLVRFRDDPDHVTPLVRLFESAGSEHSSGRGSGTQAGKSLVTQAAELFGM
jgi:hypothetical protein